LQVYAQPFISVGAYRKYKLAGMTRADRFGDRFTALAPDQLHVDGEVVGIDQDRDGLADYVIDTPDYNYRALRSTVVLRWQYRPGSSAFLIWSQGRESSTLDRDLAFGRDLSGLFDEDGAQVVMLKVNYWLGR